MKASGDTAVETWPRMVVDDIEGDFQVICVRAVA